MRVWGESEAVSSCIYDLQCINMPTSHTHPPPHPYTLPPPHLPTSILRTRMTLVPSFLRRSTMLPFLRTFRLAALSLRLVAVQCYHS